MTICWATEMPSLLWHDAESSQGLHPQHWMGPKSRDTDYATESERMGYYPTYYCL